MGKTDKNAEKKSKAKTDPKKGKKGKKGKDAATAEGVSIAGHPRAAAQVRRAKGWGGVGGFVIAGYLSFSAHIPPDQVGIRALGFGVAGYMLAWACSVAIWRNLMLAEIRTLVETRMEPDAPSAARQDNRRDDAAITGPASE
jgi:hypothetical protein